MTDDNIFFTKLQIPAGYKEVVSNIKKQLELQDYNNIINKFSSLKESLGLFDMPFLISDNIIESKEFLPKQTIMFSQSEYLGNIAKSAPIDVKPILYHYAENSLFSFFVYSIIGYPNTHSSGHGLQISWDNNIDKIKIQIRNTGFFSRLLDCYAICGASNLFSAIEYNRLESKFEKTTSKYSLKNEPKLELHEIISLREKFGTNHQGHLYDIIDFLLVFIASSLARYRPYMWNEITRGEKGTQYVWFNQCFE